MLSPSITADSRTAIVRGGIYGLLYPDRFARALGAHDEALHEPAPTGGLGALHGAELFVDERTAPDTHLEVRLPRRLRRGRQNLDAEGPQSAEAFLVVDGLPDALVEAIVRNPEGLEEDLVLRLKVVRQHAGRVARLFGDEPCRRAVKPVLDDRLPRRLRQFVPTFLMVDNLRHGVTTLPHGRSWPATSSLTEASAVGRFRPLDLISGARL